MMMNGWNVHMAALNRTSMVYMPRRSATMSCQLKHYYYVSIRSEIQAYNASNTVSSTGTLFAH